MVRVAALLLLLPKPKLNPPTIAVVDIDEWAGEEDDDDVELFISFSFSFSFFPVAGNWKKWKKFQALYQFCRYKQMGQVKMWLERARL